MPFAFAPVRAVRRPRAVLYRRSAQQSLAHQEQIHQRASHKQAVRILVQSAIAHLDEPKLEFEYGKDVFHLGSYFGLGPVLLPFYLVDAILVAIALVGKVLGVRRMFAQHLALPAIGLIAPYPRLFAVQ